MFSSNPPIPPVQPAASGYNSQLAEKQEAMYQGKKYTIVSEKLTGGQICIVFAAIFLTILAFPLTLTA